ncbi:hypothetical protein CBR_g30708 [Chara braunii]|uniref:Uncharacterized protein n=1 Tax=Chara braunii TaxID=69332 RepID=A0A388LDF7_CHABU|nr:hypothetical protein CBR_g30708 [Chara braunii]|eukprot:GBG80340.1 hypothetical protein CBR_g30708 [Chara braunii]
MEVPLVSRKGASYRDYRSPRSILADKGVWMWMYHDASFEHDRRGRVVPDSLRIDVRAYIYIDRTAEVTIIVESLTLGESTSIRKAEDILDAEVRDTVRGDEDFFERRRPWCRDTKPCPVRGHLTLAAPGYFPYPQGFFDVAAVIPLFVVDQLFGGIGSLAQSYLLTQELERLFQSNVQRRLFYSTQLLRGFADGEDPIKLVEFVRSFVYLWASEGEPFPYDIFWSALSRGTDRLGGVATLFDDESYWLDEGLVRINELECHYGYHDIGEADEDWLEEESSQWIFDDDGRRIRVQPDLGLADLFGED